ncbi:hypothetical protein HYV50_05820 [Candidatus Pacearchaeota archaeon]|nr:hypothetical protein [Candidatus Pacearchaeota archaeon]
MIEVELLEWGNSIGVILPRKKIRKLGLKQGDRIEIEIIKKRRLNGFGMCRGAKPMKREEEGHEEFWR